ncbi:ATP-dependent DNA helicase RecG [Candidatus Giovannonibacteria bacterium RIFCSPHIGHO2_01_FULL_45_33]|uniref:ATP-dependent DNA helicase RecG n=1 Tax=Candidatus Giovannonibacteria bacterium RIFCSPLOWO2_01_FULL_45_34 TaxID=1798351 RepID=A0A1F5X1P2_9BACT|nr:MAG: ATP-dependent DNA helicase RecG [Candidatus Giovannonibacteria bacterium RIFCSPHIGHO2_01_FULL_45_33]OGF70906.1 MAG: ATP-dependent DNA helicase RecG [Candidatus Giovannonibacteria bacterium RIFCSPHIGHO2_02_FULL_44_11]OGF81815.1 MAG: ATP-dependent DNA helicase RecG [Candidatus Giovannonibacteria bacterium RIFCSPLOWO2_01_FULL_45_34]
MDLSTPLEQIFRQLSPKQKSGLKNLGLKTAEDLLGHFPYRYENPADLKKIAEVITGEKVRIWGRVQKIDFEKTWKKKMNIAYATVEDPTGRIKMVWFRQPYIARMLPAGSCAIFSGTVASRKDGYYIANPLYERVACSVVPEFTKEDSSRLQPLYPSTAGLSSLWISKAVVKVLALVKADEFLPEKIIEKYHLPTLQTALRWAHIPKTEEHSSAAKKRFAFEGVFLMQLMRASQKEEIKKTAGIKLSNIEALRDEFIKLLPFGLTDAQKKSIEDILSDLKSGHPMNRLLEGDVGSGKTAVAACAAYIVAKNGMQAAYMAPTEILARQHFETFSKVLGKANIKVGLLTSGFSEKFPSKIAREKSTHVSRSQLLKWVREGEFPILIGTHSLIEKKVEFKNLALAMVDEQHRFGVSQRGKLSHKESGMPMPHFLSMTATPIPRTLALTIYADLDLSVISEMPLGRVPIDTKIVPPKDRNLAYEFIRQKLNQGEQAFVICPRIEPAEPSSEGFMQAEMKSVKEEYKKLNEKIFPEFEIALMHGKLTPKEKDETMRVFRENKIQVLVSTSVVEVGVDVPNATIMMIEGAERFGLAQLHQFRGRVGRGEKKSHCFVLPSSYSADIFRRLKALTEAKTGFELAEYDLEFRGAGELSGRKQSGLSDIGMEALKNLKMVEAARFEAREIIEQKILGKYPLLETKIKELRMEPLHFE